MSETDDFVLQDQGFIKLTIGEVTKDIDLVRLNDTFADLQQQHGNGTDKEREAIIAHMVGIGYPTFSHELAITLKRGIVKRMADRLGKGEPAQPVTSSPS